MAALPELVAAGAIRPVFAGKAVVADLVGAIRFLFDKLSLLSDEVRLRDCVKRDSDHICQLIAFLTDDQDDNGPVRGKGSSGRGFAFLT